MGWEGIVADWALGQLVHYDTDIQRWDNNLQFLHTALGKNIFNVANALPPQSGITPASVELGESSAADTAKLVWHDALFDADTDEGLIWEFTSWFASSDITGFTIGGTMDTNNTSASIVGRIQFAALSDSDASATAKAFSTDNDATITVPDAENTYFTGNIPTSNLDSVTYGDRCYLLFQRVGTDSDDGATGDFAFRHLYPYK